MEEGHEVLVEQYCEGIDVTVPVLGGENPVILGYVQPKSDKPGSIITEDLKLHDHLGYQLVSAQDMEQDIASDVRKSGALWGRWTISASTIESTSRRENGAFWK